MAHNAAAALDAADGRMDGRFFGRPIVQGGPRPPPGGMPPQGPPPGGMPGGMPGMPPQSGAAAALDAADGKMDGRFFGRPIVQQGAPPPGALVPYSGAAPAQASPMGYGYGAPAMPVPTMGFGGGFGAVPAAAYSPATFYGGGATAFNTGGIYGAPVYNNFNTFGSTFGTGFTPGVYGSGFNTIGAGVPLYGTGMMNSGFVGGGYGGVGGVSSFGSYGGFTPQVYGAATPQLYGGGGFVGGFGGRPAVTPVGAANTMAGRMALDAADGVMDGNYFGSRIV